MNTEESKNIVKLQSIEELVKKEELTGPYTIDFTGTIKNANKLLTAVKKLKMFTEETNYNRVIQKLESLTISDYNTSDAEIIDYSYDKRSKDSLPEKIKIILNKMYNKNRNEDRKGCIYFSGTTELNVECDNLDIRDKVKGLIIGQTSSNKWNIAFQKTDDPDPYGAYGYRNRTAIFFDPDEKTTINIAEYGFTGVPEPDSIKIMIQTETNKDKRRVFVKPDIQIISQEKFEDICPNAKYYLKFNSRSGEVYYLPHAEIDWKWS